VIELRVPRSIDLEDVAKLQPKNKQDEASIADYEFTENIIPPKRGNYYRLCDIKDDVMKLVIHSNENKKSTCNVSDVVNCLLMCTQFYRKNMGGVKVTLMEN